MTIATISAVESQRWQRLGWDMKIFEGELDQSQIDAALIVMKGRFTASKVMGALQAAGVENIVSATEAVISRELQLKNIRRITPGIYENC